MQQTQLLNIFGAKLSKDGSKIVLVMVSGEADKRKYYNACIPVNKDFYDKQPVVLGEVVKGKEDSYAYIMCKMLEEKPATPKGDELPFKIWY